MDSLAYKEKPADLGDPDDSDESIESKEYSNYQAPIALPLSSYTKKGAQELVNFLNVSTRLFAGKCEGDKGLEIIYQNYSPYLYPFSVEYSILVGKIISRL